MNANTSQNPDGSVSTGAWRAWISRDKPYGAMPVELGTLVDVRYRDGGERHGVPAGKDTGGPAYRDAERRFWHQERHHSDIMFWRPAAQVIEDESQVGNADAPQDSGQ